MRFSLACLSVLAAVESYKFPCTPLRSSSRSLSPASRVTTRGNGRTSPTMYFDDISFSASLPSVAPSSSSSMGPSAEIMEDPTTAHQVSDDDLKDHLDNWIESTIIRTALDNRMKDENAIPLRRPPMQYDVIREERPIACLAHFWKTLNLVIDTATKDESVTMVSFPQSPALLDYNVFSLLDKAVDFSAPLCVDFGTRIHLTHYHPQFKNAPKLLYMGRHSPFPVLGLTVKNIEDETSVLDADLSEMPRLAAERKKRGKSMIRLFDEGVTHQRAPELPPHDPPTSVADTINPKLSRTSLSLLFNRAAAPSTVDEVPNHCSRNVDKRITEDDEVIQQLEDWIAKVKGRQGKSGGVANKVKASNNRMNEMGFQAKQPKEDAKSAAEYIDPLEYIDTSEGFVLSREQSPEKVLADVWQAISDMEAIGIEKDMEVIRARAANPKKRFEHLAWMETLASPRKKEAVSKLFVTPNYATFNAATFKRMAIALSQPLAKLNPKMFVVVFHPEYVGKKGVDVEVRRAPWPMLQICYEYEKDP